MFGKKPACRIATCISLLLTQFPLSAVATDEAIEHIEGIGFSIDVYTSTPHGYSVTSTIIYGSGNAILIDPQFLLPEADAVAELIRNSSKKLTLIYSTYAHPDHFLGVAAIPDAFPDTQYVALPDVRERMIAAWPARRNFWHDIYGDELPGAEAILPEPLAEPCALELEGHLFPVTSDQIGLDGPGNSFVYLDVLNTVVSGDIIFNSHFRLPADTAPLYDTLARIAALRSAYVIAGHQARSSNSAASVLDFIREYIGAFRMARALSANPAELQEKMLLLYPDLGRPDALEQVSDRAFQE